jgi:predicted RNA binding protein YcfA (HicA-like mRNA interferase family)
MTAREVVRELVQRGCRFLRQRGSHAFYVCPCGAHAATVAMHRGDVPIATLRAIERSFEPCPAGGRLRR